MKLLIKKAIIVDARSPFNNQTVDILIENDIISEIATTIENSDAEVWAFENAHVSIGWTDIGTYTNDPGFEFKDDLNSISNAAAKGGFTHILSAANTSPAIHSKSEVLYIINNTRHQLTDFHPLGGITKDIKGKELAELYDMTSVGAVGFSDGYHSIQHSGILLRALMYAKAFDGTIINQPLDEQIASGGYAHEGLQSTMVGMKGIPALAESMMVQRDLYILEYANSKLHLANISTQKSVELIREAKSKGLKVTASVNPMNLYFNDKVIQDFDTNYKVSPPIRSEEHQKALIEGFKDGTIDCIVSNHRPQDTESKRLEFMYADDGVNMLETAFSTALMATENHIPLVEIIKKLTTQPRQIFNLPQNTIDKNQTADLTIFNPNQEWIFKNHQSASKSNNSPFDGKTLKGKVLGVVNNGQSKKF
jgi:dihydroorotase